MSTRLSRVVSIIAGLTVLLSRGAVRAASIQLVPVPGRHLERVTIDNAARSYIVHVPPEFDGRRKVPAVVMPHGAGGSAEEAETYTGFDIESDHERFIVAYPNATLPFPNRAGGRCTNPALWHERTGLGDLARSHRADIDFISAVIDNLEAHYCADPDRIYITGFSNGASMTFSLGVNLSDRLAAIAPVSGSVAERARTTQLSAAAALHSWQRRPDTSYRGRRIAMDRR